jgi:sulfatase maturation enzyme AslB (radical SAM superfamily)
MNESISAPEHEGLSAACELPEQVTGFKPLSASGLPIFRWDCAEYVIFYAPGCLVVVTALDADRFADRLMTPGCTGEFLAGSARHTRPEGHGDKTQAIDWKAALWWQAQVAGMKVAARQNEPFRPECLTLFMNNECNLRCVYCCTDPSSQASLRLEPDVIAKAADLVAANCREKGRPLMAVFHGGGSQSAFVPIPSL